MCMRFPDGKQWFGLLCVVIEEACRHFGFIAIEKKRRNSEIIDEWHIHCDSEPRRIGVLKCAQDSAERDGRIETVNQRVEARRDLLFFPA